MSIVNLKYDYQQEMYEEIKDLIDSGETSICYVLCMGLGKTYIFLKILEDYFIGKRVLYIAPKHTIINSLKEKPEYIELQKQMTIDTVTFAHFNKERPTYTASYDGMFIDEMHHCNSPIQGNNIVKLKSAIESTPSKLCVGFSATPLFKSAYTRKMVDIRDLFTHGVTGMSIADAIRKGFLPKIKYAIAIPDIDELLKGSGHSLNEYRFRYSIDSTKSMLENIILENSEINHWVAIFSTKELLNEGVKQFKQAFPEYNIYKMYSGMPDNPTSVMNQFENDPGKCILTSINMLLEGVHLKTCDGILLYRNPNEQVFVQIIGRLLDIELQERSPIFVDVMNVGSKLDLHSCFEYDLILEDNSTQGHHIRSKHAIEPLKDIIDVHCKAYRYVQLLEDIINDISGQKEICVDGEKFVYTTYADLGRQLGLSHNGASATMYRRRREGWSLEEICRYYLELNRPNVATIDGKEIKWRSIYNLKTLLEVDFGVNMSYDLAKKLVNAGYTPQEMKDYVKPGERNSGSVVLNGKTIYYKTLADLSLKLGKHHSFVSRHLRNGKTMDDIISMVESGGLETVEIEGVKYEFRSDRDLAKQLGLSKSKISYYKKRTSGTTEDAIREITKRYSVIINGEEFRFKDYQELSRKLGMQKQYVSIKLGKGLTLQEIVDECTPTRITVDGKLYEFSTDRQLSKLLGKSAGYVGCVKHYHCVDDINDYEQIIRYANKSKNTRE